MKAEDVEVGHLITRTVTYTSKITRIDDQGIYFDEPEFPGFMPAIALVRGLKTGGIKINNHWGEVMSPKVYTTCRNVLDAIKGDGE